jgi:hypothetical protein
MAVDDVRTFSILYGSWKPLLVALGMGPRFSGVEIGGGELRVRMGWAFRSRIPLGSVTGARTLTGRVGGVGVHGWRGRWLVNGSMNAIVGIDIDPEARALATGMPVRLHYLSLSLEDPDGFLAALGVGTGTEPVSPA